MNGFYALSQRRQSCRSFDPERPVEREKLVQIIEAGCNAASGCNSQPWSFVVVQDLEMVREIAKAGQQLGINGFLDDARAFIIVLEEHAVLMNRIRCMLDSQYFAPNDIGGAIAHICLMAADLDLGSCQIGLFDRDRIRELLDIPQHKRFASSIIALGYPKNDVIREKKRKSVEEITRFV